MAIIDWPAAERPREKLLRQGAEALSDAELLAIFLRTGVTGMDAVTLARQLLGQFDGLSRLMRANQQQFCAAKGLGQAKYAQLQAVVELSRRVFQAELHQSDVLNHPAAVERYLRVKMGDSPIERFALLLLDSQNRVLAYKELSHGTINQAAVYPREVLRLVIEEHAAAVILCHNHPSGVCEPSEADRHITDKIMATLAFIDVRVLDHLVVGRTESTSFAARGWI
ncbi:JAB domain-containing protein [Corallincola holothuriorum]|uniref:JAB domain-containing protein n=1 Tax=Corallincola holothuriorum TaxID=2282215 RepID=A0A368NNM9_9GAMM|nr:DNA repair protein RadC [Corallincola holothuriorum]RCU51069.1 JAB domain-containing protein [Corallincola holothuriorum]